VLLRIPPGANPSAGIAGGTITNLNYNAAEHLAWIRFTNESKPRELSVRLK